MLGERDAGAMARAPGVAGGYPDGAAPESHPGFHSDVMTPDRGGFGSPTSDGGKLDSQLTGGSRSLPSVVLRK